MIQLHPGHWHRYNMGNNGGIIVSYECPDCKKWFNISGSFVAKDGRVTSGSPTRCTCNFYGHLQLVGWEG